MALVAQVALTVAMFVFLALVSPWLAAAAACAVGVGLAEVIGGTP